MTSTISFLSNWYVLRHSQMGHQNPGPYIIEPPTSRFDHERSTTELFQPSDVIFLIYMFTYSINLIIDDPVPLSSPLDL